MPPSFSCGEPAVSHNDELSLFLQEVADVRPLRSDHIAPVGQQQPAHRGATRAPGGRHRRAAHPGSPPQHGGCPYAGPHDIVGFKRDGVQEGVYKKLRLGKYELQGPRPAPQDAQRGANRPGAVHCRSAKCGTSAAWLILHAARGAAARRAPLLKSHVSAWLPQLPAAMAIHSAERRHGGSGALLRIAAQERAQEGGKPRTAPEAPG